MLELILHLLLTVVTFAAGILPLRCFSRSNQWLFYIIMLPLGAFYSSQYSISILHFSGFVLGFALGLLAKLCAADKKEKEFVPIVINGGRKR